MKTHPSPEKFRLVLTGASGGIGQKLAEAMAPFSATMLLVGRNANALVALQNELNKINPALTVSIAACDLGTAQGRETVLNTAQGMPGGINLLVNNAGVLDFHGFATQDEAMIESLIHTNLISPILLTRKLLPLLQNGQARLPLPSPPQPAGEGDAVSLREADMSWAQVVNIGSAFGDIGYPGFAAYCASKFGLRGFSQALRRELSDSRIRVRYFAPRATRTGINSSAVNRMNAELNTAMDEPEIVASAFLKFLAGNKMESVLGWPENLYVFVNRLRHQLTDKAIGKQLAIIKKYLPV
ncbi:MAG: SDR family NAD(P)-dependent oxidoreductase [Sulfuricellaceae bacterium]|nr:SDR family NAD(P)-dependent oxidoreductase [Sulfuricellaceae bacterium]